MWCGFLLLFRLIIIASTCHWCVRCNRIRWHCVCYVIAYLFRIGSYINLCVVLIIILFGNRQRREQQRLNELWSVNVKCLISAAFFSGNKIVFTFLHGCVRVGPDLSRLMLAAWNASIGTGYWGSIDLPYCSAFQHLNEIEMLICHIELWDIYDLRMLLR